MKRTLAAIAVTGALAGCTLRSHESTAPTSTSTPPPVAVPTVPAAVTRQVSVAPVAAGGGLFAEGSSGAAAPASVVAPARAPGPTVLVPVPPLPADMQKVRPSTPPSVLEPDEHDHDNDELGAGDVAAEWIAAVYTGRYDDPPSAVAEALRPLAVNETVVDAALDTVGSIDVAGGEARWPYIVEITASGGWWQASVLVKATRFGQVGPSSTPLTVRVHVTDDLLVDDWEQTS